jgi:hypothetical protein
MNHLKHLTWNGTFFGWQNVDGYQRMQNYPKILQNRTDRIKTHKSVVIADRNEVENAGRVEMWTGAVWKISGREKWLPKEEFD